MGVRIRVQCRFRNCSTGSFGCLINGSTGRRRGGWDTKKEKWRRSNLLLCTFLVLFSGLGLVSSAKWDGVIVTQADYQALRALKHELIDAKGVLKSWNDTSNGACSGEWTGIKCVDGQVVVIQLPWKGLGGRISEKIGQLQALRRLSLHDNFLVGPVPMAIGFLPNLRGIYLFNNRLSGTIPPSIGNSLVLQTLDLSNNQLIGKIPPSLANSTRFYKLNLSFNGLSGSIPLTLSQNPSLTFLALQNNNISGSIPDTWSSKTSNHSYNLQSLNLSYNRINGTIPEEFHNLLNLNSLDLSNNAITGTFPLSFTNLSSLVTLNLENNNLDSQIPESIENLRYLSVLNLSNNKFKGQIPGTIGNITSLTFLDLSHNNLSMEIPTSLASLPNVDSFNVSYNNLSGPVPSVLANRFKSSSFIGNIQLCGYSNLTPCPSVKPENLPLPEKHHRKLSSKDIILISAGALLVVLLILCCVLMCCLIRKKAASRKSKPGGVLAKESPAAGNMVESGGETGGKLVHFDGPFVFTADDLLCATAEIMGKSSYGTAYKATLEDNNVVAVKRLREKITKPQNEFEIEASELGKIRHPNILALRAYYLGPKGEKLIVYDYMPNGSLASFLHARGPETNIPWPKRMAIAIGITRGLGYLHTEQDIVHGNLTSSNVLLDEQNNPEIADVGLSRLMTNAANTNIVATAGTMGYRAPELSKIKNATTKTDVFSLGVIMLELLTGKSPSEATDGLDLPQWVASTVKDEWTNEVFDVELMRDASNIGDELLNTLKLALHCVDPSPTSRPEAHQVLQKLEEIKPEMDTQVNNIPASGDDATAVEAKVE